MQTNKPVVFFPRRDTHKNWMSVNPILRAGELAYDYDSNQFRIGDGIKHWRDLIPFTMPTDWCGYSTNGTPLLRFQVPEQTK